MELCEEVVDIGAERTLLAILLQNTDSIVECQSEGLLPKHFAVMAHSIIYSAIMYLFANSDNVDVISIYNSIKDKKAKDIIDDFGGLEYLSILLQSPITSNVKLIVTKIFTNYTKRNVIEKCDAIKQDMINKDMNNVEIVEHVSRILSDISVDDLQIAPTYKFGSKLNERLEQLSKEPTLVPGLPSGFAEFDKATKGGQPGDLILIGAESKTGKSVLLMNWAKYQAIDLDYPVLYIDTEQSDEEEEMRLLSMVSGVPEDEITTGYFTKDTGYGLAKDKIQAIETAKRKINNAQFYHIFMPEFTLEKLQAVTKQFKLKHNIQALYFDYINFNPLILGTYKHLRDDLILTNLTQGLKDLAGNLKIPIYSAFQENRAGYGSTEKDAKNIGGSIGILQKATKLCFLRNKTEAELVQHGVSKGNQVLMLKYQRHGDYDLEFNIMFDRIRITQTEV